MTTSAATLVTQQEFDKLLAFLPKFESQNQAWIINWDGNTPNYQPDVETFFNLVYEGGWIYSGYNPSESGKMLNHDSMIQTATWEQIKMMMTFCVRSEHFCYGAWAGLLQNGKILKLLKRIQELGPEA